MFKTYILLAITVIPLCASKQYRTDYIYNKKSNAFYKFHIEGSFQYNARHICTLEGAQLLHPTTELDTAQVHGMMKQYPDLGNYVWVMEKYSSHETSSEVPEITYTETNEPVGGNPLRACSVMNRNGEVEPHSCIRMLPFVCKVDASDAYYDSACKVYGKGYKYVQDIGSCYKVPPVAFSWNEAYAECKAEGAHLVVLNSDAERNAVMSIASTAQNPAVVTWFFIAGFRANKPTDNKPRVFMTIFNQTLEEAGFNIWSANEPNNAKNNEYCGSIFKNDGKLNDVDCTHRFAFICEKEV